MIQSNDLAEPAKPGGKILLYQTADQQTRISVRLEGRTVWLTVAQMADLFQISPGAVRARIRGVLRGGECDPATTARKFPSTPAGPGRQGSRPATAYNLEVILAVGYRVRSQRGRQFRRWATNLLATYLAQGSVMDPDRLANPPGPRAPDYFDELLETIRDIRASESRIYLRVREILALAADYQPGDAASQDFFRTAQNKLYFAATGHTAAELIAARADARQPNMGLTSWRGRTLRKADATVAKNYLRSREISQLNRLTTLFLDFAEDQARQRQQIFLRDWREKLDEFLHLNQRPVLTGEGSVPPEAATRHAKEEYDRFIQSRGRALHVHSNELS